MTSLLTLLPCWPLPSVGFIAPEPLPPPRPPEPPPLWPAVVPRSASTLPGVDANEASPSSVEFKPGVVAETPFEETAPVGKLSEATQSELFGFASQIQVRFDAASS